MNYEPQKITAPDGTALIVIAESDYIALVDAADIAAANRALAESDFMVPGEVVNAMLDGKNAIVAWRDHLGITQTLLARRAGVLQPALARTEAGRTKPRAVTLNKLAAALEVPVWALTLDQDNSAK